MLCSLLIELRLLALRLTVTAGTMTTGSCALVPRKMPLARQQKLLSSKTSNRTRTPQPSRRRTQRRNPPTAKGEPGQRAQLYACVDPSRCRSFSEISAWPGVVGK